ncbi:MAG: hypothetical protein ABIP57_03750 [Jatrophihabitantaceae bacterium]
MIAAPAPAPASRLRRRCAAAGWAALVPGLLLLLCLVNLTATRSHQTELDRDPATSVIAAPTFPAGVQAVLVAAPVVPLHPIRPGHGESIAVTAAASVVLVLAAMLATGWRPAGHPSLRSAQRPRADRGPPDASGR